MKNVWNIVHDCDDENGEPTCWAKEISHSKYGSFVWIEKNRNGFDVTVGDGVLMKSCKSLASAKRWGALNIR